MSTIPPNKSIASAESNVPRAYIEPHSPWLKLNVPLISLAYNDIKNVCPKHDEKYIKMHANNHLELYLINSITWLYKFKFSEALGALSQRR